MVIWPAEGVCPSVCLSVYVKKCKAPIHTYKHAYTNTDINSIHIIMHIYTYTYKHTLYLYIYSNICAMVKTCQNKVHESSHHFLQDSPNDVHRPTLLRQPPSIVLSGGGFSNDLEAECTLVDQTQSGSKWHMRVSIDGGTPKWLVYRGKYY